MIPERIQIIHSIVEFYSEHLGNGKCGLVVKGKVAHLSAEFYTQSARDLHAEIGIFSSIADAEKWIRHSPAYYDRMQIPIMM